MSELNAKISMLQQYGWYRWFGAFAICRLCHKQIYRTAFCSPKGTAYHETCAVGTNQAKKVFRSFLLTDDELRSIGLL